MSIDTHSSGVLPPQGPHLDLACLLAEGTRGAECVDNIIVAGLLGKTELGAHLAPLLTGNNCTDISMSR